MVSGQGVVPRHREDAPVMHRVRLARCVKRPGDRGEVRVKKLYIGNLPYSATEDEVRQEFERFGSVQSVALISDRDTGRAKGFGFVEMDDAGADKAIEQMDGKDFGGRPLRVNEARPREDRRPFYR